jgi:ABC-2 type transport system ATP-binding protein
MSQSGSQGVSQNAIELIGVRKRFGRNEVLAGVDLRVPAGKTYAFLGRNGAGKTTTIRTLMGLLAPDAGAVRVQGVDPRADAMAIRRSVGYLAEDQQMWGWMKVSEILGFMAPFYPTWDWDLAKDLLDRFALAGGTKIKHLSKGQNVRLGLLLALSHKPKLVILDDPALGLDPIMRKEFLRDVVTHLQGTEGVTVFFSSHLLYEVEPVADVVGILDGGKMVCEAETEVLREEVRQIWVEPAAWEERGRFEGILDVRRDGHRTAAVVRDVRKAREALGGVIQEERQLNLDEIFEAFVAGRKEVGRGQCAAVERMA